MPEKNKESAREKTLVTVLERIGGELLKHDALLVEIKNKQDEFARITQSTELRQNAQRNSVEIAQDNVQKSISQYRSTMLSLVNEQDQINNGMKELRGLISKIGYTLEINNQKIIELDKRVTAQEKSLREHFEHSQKASEKISKVDERVIAQDKPRRDHHEASQKTSEKIKEIDERLFVLERLLREHFEHSQKTSEMIPREITDAGHKINKMHADSEKRLGELHLATQKQLEKLQQETARKLLALDGIESALETILIRTEPPVKKKPWIVRVFRRIGLLFRKKS